MSFWIQPPDEAPKPGMKIGRKQRPPTPRWLHALQTPASALGILGSYGLFQDNFPLFCQAAGIPSLLGAQKLPKHHRALFFGRCFTPNWTLLVHTTNSFNDMPLFLSLTLPSVDTLRRLLSTGMGVGDDEFCFGITLPETNSKIKLNIGFQSSIFRVELLVSGAFVFNSLNIRISLIEDVFWNS